MNAGLTAHLVNFLMVRQCALKPMISQAGAADAGSCMPRQCWPAASMATAPGRRAQEEC